MNDFTKEELNHMIEIIDELYFGKFYAKDEYPKLYSKIQYMIDSYCEHEWENICCQCTLDKIYCHKCEKDMGDLKERYPNDA